MNVQKEEITAMKMLPALTPLVALSVLAKLALLEMESTAQVRFGLMNEYYVNFPSVSGGGHTL